ncbi:hypothetical protein [Enterovirga sp. CN4-39]|uniref:hypothetical protein n=1 Tax=Enterovirga sp. CN4-39 TaxID=3400910 RepID=UPI003BFD4A90
MVRREWLDLSREDEETRLFDTLRTLSESLTTEGRIIGRDLDLDDFDTLADNLAVIRPAKRFGDFRFEFYGSAFSEASPAGDLNGVAFGDLLDSPYYRANLAGVRHVHRLGLAHVTRDHPIIGGGFRFFTRLLVPIFAGNETALILCAARLHDEETIVHPPAPEPEPERLRATA